MSENIQSISQGTYTIGQTSATNFVAGPGIKIDQPSEGVVRIGNDETVLWSGASTGTSAGSFTENIFNFERFGVYWIMNNDGTYQSPTYQEFWTKPDTNYYLHIGFGNTYCYQGTINFSIASGGFTANKAQGTQITAWNAAATISTIDTPYLSKMRNGFTKIIGINRISGGNE